MLMLSRFPKTQILLESTLWRKGGIPEDVLSVLPMGLVTRKNWVAETLYLLQRPQTDKKCLNIVQVSSCC